jgi:exosortase A
MTAFAPIPQPEVGRLAGWPLHLAVLVAASATLLIVFGRDAADMVRIWNESSTFNHCFLILPIIAWLVWQRLPGLRELKPTTWTPGLLVVAAGGLGWLLGEAGGIATFRHAGLLLMLEGMVAACLGPVLVRALAFPLFYAVFLIPFGEELMGPLQLLTAHMCMVLLALVGIPAHLEGVFIATPAGLFEVAEACSGVSFLVAMLAYGALVANLCFRSPLRRALFMAAAILIPLIANGVRAWGTIVIASLTGIEFAAGFDHIFYGWVFFAIVIALLMACGWRFFDRRPSDPWFDPAELQPEPPATGLPRGIVALAAGGILIAAAPLGWSAHLAATGIGAVPKRIAMPAPDGWQPVANSEGRPWRPHFAGADRLRVQSYRDSAGRTVELAIAVFARQREGAELVGFGQGPAGPDSAWRWTGTGSPPPGGRLDRIGSFGTVREVATFYRLGTILTGDSFAVKLATTRTRLLGGPQRAVAVMVSAEAPADGVSPRPAIDDFLAALGPLEPVADRAAGGA